MKIRILYFALLRDAIGRAQEELDVPEDVTTVAALREWLLRRGEAYESALGNARRGARQSTRKWPNPTTP